MERMTLIGNMREQLARLAEGYAELFAEDMPESLTDLTARITAEEERLKNNILRQAADAFLRLTAKDEELIPLLQEKQTELTAILERADSHNEEELLRHYADFIDAIDEKDVVKKVEYVQSLAPYFGSILVAHGVIAHRLEAPGVTAAPKSKKEKRKEKKLKEAGIKKDETKPKNKTAKSKTTDSEIGQEEVKAPAKKEAPTLSEEEIKARIAQVAALLTENNFRLQADEDYGEFIYEHSPQEEKEFKPSKFDNEILRPAPQREKRLILRQASRLGSVSYDLLKSFAKGAEELVQVALDFLLKRGYLRLYEFKDLGRIYGTSPRFGQMMASQDITGKLGLQRRKKPSAESWLEPRSIYAAPRLAYIKVLTHMLATQKQRLEAKKTPHSHPLTGDEQKKCMRPDAFYSYCHEKDYLDLADLLIGCFWVSPDNADDFLEILTQDLPGMDPIARLVICAATKEQALAAYEVLTAKLPKLKDITPLYTYALLTDKFYAGETEMTPEEIWPLPEEKETPPAEIPSDAAPVVEKASDGTEDKAPVPLQATTCPKAKAKAKAPEQEAPPAALTTALVTTVEYTPALEEQAVTAACEMIIDHKPYCATAYLKFCALSCPEMEPSYLRLAYAVNDPVAQCHYNSNKIYELYGGATAGYDEYLMVAASLRTFWLDYAGFDYGMETLHDSLKDTAPVAQLTPLSDLLYLLMDFKQQTHKGVDHYADYRAKTKKQLEAQMDAVRREADDTYRQLAENPIKEKANQRRFIETKKILFNRKNDLATYLEAAKNDDRDYLTLVSEYLREKFLRESSTLENALIDTEKLNRLIDEAWHEAGDRVLHVKKNMDLMGSLRSNVCNNVKKIVDILCEWTVCAEALSEEGDDSGSLRYKKISAKLRENTESAMDSLRQKLESTANEVGDKAGILILLYTLGEFALRINGNYAPERRNYFYIDFLRSPHVLLTDDYVPDFRRTFDPDNPAFFPERIEAHMRSDLLGFEEAIRYDFEGGGDNFRSARMMDECLKERQGKSVIEAEGYDHESEEYARNDIAKIRDDFIGHLELAQSYGQIDNIRENKKEKILQILGEWYEYALDSKDFGVFRQVTEYWKTKISEDARVRETALSREIDFYLKKSGHTEAAVSRVENIRRMIAQQNYTVAEDMLHRLTRDEPDMAEGSGYTFEDDYLADFLANYGFYHNKVNQSAYALSRLLKQNQRNKDTKGGARLVENWIISGGRTGPEKITNLLKTLGFAVAKLEAQPPVGNGKIENYQVTLVSPGNGQKSNYKHPIAVFGSMAEGKTGFRVACLLGKYDADGLIERYKEIGNTKNTIVLLDYALSIPERRRLARKVRLELFDKVFALIDRVLLAYLSEHYSETRVSQMLMALMMPFAYYQPYVWESSKVMPPEIFMGRKEELAKIESPQGVNIVYGGRQLGKSAMLKMAKSDIDRNENNDRAILVDIKDLPYGRAARKVSQALSDEEFFTEGLETEDWDELARAIRLRLQSKTAPYIPYFLLLMDEADVFIASCAEDNYHAFDAMKDIQSVGVGRFKFVIAGLHNIIRFNRQAALSNNTVLTHLSSLTVKPFQMNEARELLEVPLQYLGLRFPAEKESLISLILASTNYFPGLIQLYCAKLLEAMTKSDYADYDQLETPIYEIREDHIKKVLADPGFMEQIKEKFEITLKLGEDQTYYVLALILAYLYHEHGYSAGYTSEDILSVAESYEMKKLLRLPPENIAALLEELRELNILRETAEGKYLFTRYTFFQMMGSQGDVEDKLVEVMEAVG
ncbi:MAG: hypothetical protein IJ849_01340 [Selenomonadaceae bacterium]|nr:hypothetical protein [Selenomonadaceae bacterium]